MTQTLRDRRVEWGPVFILGWVGAVVFGSALLLIFGPAPSDSLGAALLVLVPAPAASIVYVVCGLILATAGVRLSRTAVPQRLEADSRPVSPLRILAGVGAACLLEDLAILGTMLFRGSAAGLEVAQWLGPHFRHF